MVIVDSQLIPSLGRGVLEGAVAGRGFDAVIAC